MITKAAQSAPGRADRKGISVLELFDMFPTDQAAREWFETIRRPNGVDTCPRCGTIGKVSPVVSGRPMPYRCGSCRKYFSVRTGTVMESSRLPLRKWVIALYLCSTNLKSVSPSGSMQTKVWLWPTQTHREAVSPKPE